MKITIQLELAASEVDLATQLCETLKGLTDDFRVQLQSAPGAAPSKEQLSELQANFEATTIAPREAPVQSQANGAAPTATLVPKHAPAPVPAPAPTQFVPPVAQPYQQQQAPIQQPHPQPAIPQQPVQQQAAPAPVPAPAPAVQQAQAAAPVSVAGLEEDIYNKFLDPLRSLNDAENVASGEIIQLLEAEYTLPNGTRMEPADVFKAFYRAFWDVTFDGTEGRSVVPYMGLVAELPEGPKTQMRNVLIPQVMKHLTIKREVEVARTEFFPHAEAFAVLVSKGFVTIPGAVNLIETLLKKAENRAAAVTMLGKMVELCHQQMEGACTPAVLDKLRRSLMAITEESFQYDKQFIQDYMNWGVANLHPATTWPGHTSPVYQMIFNPNWGTLLTQGNDGDLVIWKETGEVISSLRLPNHYAIGMDLHLPTNSLLMCCAIKSEQHNSCITAYSMQETSLKDLGAIQRPGSQLISAVTWLPRTDRMTFATGETTSLNPPGTTSICLYEIREGVQFKDLQPVSVIQTNTNWITRLSPVAVQPAMILVATSCSQVILFDLRQSLRLGAFGTVREDGLLTAHAGPVSSLEWAGDASGAIFLSSGQDGLIKAWDVRNLPGLHGPTEKEVPCPPTRVIQIDAGPINAVVLGGRPGLATIAAANGLWTLDLAQGDPPSPTLVNSFLENFVLYHKILWGANGKLYAGGVNKSIDCFQLY